ncbi:winged helix-turn-helix transcriptional regulator [Alteribacter natronophilus]|uniref:winged helix-turn-helix transcriptional regulator n=1 Tax=Alteribacter natronophilus TaxID=2583810 RepID=UPI00110E6A8F|nr:helix-turn-helix domain-containing protein [Alteribacter natronophilus]TMW73471.1 helix-turn-helix transcriptional regulator [Alteribacter natronophilus]
MDRDKLESIKTTLDVVCGKWKGIILLELVGQTLRFNELKKQLPDASHQTLIKQLKELESDGLIERKAYPVVPPKVEYSLTPYGRNLERMLEEMADWGRDHQVRKEHRETS